MDLSGRDAQRTMVIVIIGPAGAGKTTVGRALASAVGWPFLDADDFHDSASIERMRRGVALGDDERWPWLQRIREAIEDTTREHRSVVVACSALKASYRALLASDIDDVRFVYLRASRDVLSQRLKTRRGHFAGEALLDAQLATMEEPERDALTVDASQTPDAIVRIIRETWRLPVFGSTADG